MTNQTDERVLTALRILKDQERTLEAPPVIETRLLREFRRIQSRSRRRRAALWALTAVAAAGIVAIVAIATVSASHLSRRRQEAVATVSRSHVAQVPRAESGPPPVTRETSRLDTSRRETSQREASRSLPVMPKAATQKRPSGPKRSPRAVPGNESQEVVTDFFPLMDAAPPFERGELLRVTVPAWALRTVGLPVDEDHLTDPVQADVLVGEEGLARSIRFVGFRQ
jgi:hypothetical protein